MNENKYNIVFSINKVFNNTQVLILLFYSHIKQIRHMFHFLLNTNKYNTAYIPKIRNILLILSEGNLFSSNFTANCNTSSILLTLTPKGIL